MHITHIARTLRPRKFRDVVGQETAVSLLKNALTQGLMMPVCSIFGPSGVGKTTLARLIGMWQCCTNRTQDEPCGECKNCEMIINDTHPDVFELDGGTYTGVDNIKSMLESMKYSTCADNINNKRIYILDEVHMLSKHAMTALLKTFEESLDNLQFILATTNVEKLPETILSRSFQIRLEPIKQELIIDYLKKIAGMADCKVEPEALSYISYAAGGSMRQALAFFEQISIISNLNVTAEQTRELLGLASYNIIDDFIKTFEQGSVSELLGLISQVKQVNPMLFIKQLLSEIQNRISKNNASPKLIQIGYELAEASIVMHKSPYTNNLLEICLGNAIVKQSSEKKLSSLAREIF